MSAREAILAAGFVPPFGEPVKDVGYVYDAEGNTAATSFARAPFIPRGWSRIERLKNGEQLASDWAKAFYDTVGREETDIDTVILKLNRACEGR